MCTTLNVLFSVPSSPPPFFNNTGSIILGHAVLRLAPALSQAVAPQRCCAGRASKPVQCCDPLFSTAHDVNNQYIL